MAKMGRPLTEISQDSFEKLCGLQCTEIEIAAFFGCSVDTIDRWCKRTYKRTFADVFKEKRERGKVSLRRSQWKLADHNPTMAIWLGKQYLGQKDKTETELTVARDKDDVIAEMEEYFHEQGTDPANAEGRTV